MLPLQILVISLEHSSARQAKVASEMAKTNLEWRFVDAVDGSKLDLSTVPYLEAKVERMQGYTLTTREIGCYLSHMKCWQACLRQNKPTLIFEDDFVLQPHFQSVLQELLNNQRGWQMVRLQALEDKPHAEIVKLGAYQLVKIQGDPLGATAYLVRPDAARVLLEHSAEIYEPLDHYIEHFEKHGLRMWAVKPYPVTVVDPTRETSTITDRPDRRPVRGGRKFLRSFYRLVDRLLSNNPYFPSRFRPR